MGELRTSSEVFVQNYLLDNGKRVRQSNAHICICEAVGELGKRPSAAALALPERGLRNARIRNVSRKAVYPHARVLDMAGHCARDDAEGNNEAHSLGSQALSRISASSER